MVWGAGFAGPSRRANGPCGGRPGETRKRRLDSSSRARGSRPDRAFSVLVVDDEPAIRLICRTNLRAAGLTVLEAADGPEALSIARREQPALILLDMMMPGLDGLEVIERMAADERTAEIPIAFLSARTEPDDIRRGIELGAVGYFTKPFDPVRLSHEVQSLLERLRDEGLRQVREQTRARHLGEAGPEGEPPPTA